MLHLISDDIGLLVTKLWQVKEFHLVSTVFATAENKWMQHLFVAYVNSSFLSLKLSLPSSWDLRIIFQVWDTETKKTQFCP